MQAVLYICHGTRKKLGIQEAVDFIYETMNLVNIPIQEYCFLELASPSILEGIKNCIKKGATKIAFVPVLLLSAVHAKKDIPQILKQAKEMHKNIEFRYGKPLGVQEKLVDILVERIGENVMIRDGMEILLVGRGTSDIDAINDTQQIVEILQRKINRSTVTISKCFLTAATPKFEILLVDKVLSGSNSIVILPYLLFKGLLMNGIEKFVQRLRLQPNQEVVICNHIGNHQIASEVLKTRVLETFESGKLVT